MTNEEAEKTFVELTKILDEVGLRWIADSVQDEIQLGSLVDVNQSDMSPGEFKSASKLVQPSYRKAIRKSANFVVRKEYSQTERLVMLVDAVEHVVIQGNACEESVLAYFKETGGPPGIQFASERPDVPTVSDQASATERRHGMSETLSTLLRELRADVNP